MFRLTVASVALISCSIVARADVVPVKTPNRGIQPQALTDAKGNVHLLYFDGEPKAGNLMYARREAVPLAPRPGGEGLGVRDFAAPIKVNTHPGSAIAVGTIRGGQIALGKDGRVHVAWNGSMKAAPKNALGGHPMLYARLADDGKSFESERNLMTHTHVLDGGGCLAADAKGNVFVAWHALDKDAAKGEGNRQVFVAVSRDDGKTFAVEMPAWKTPTGACGCCGMRGFADAKGNVHFLYRAASEKTNRGMYALFSGDQGKGFTGERLDNWMIATCPMSSEAIAESPDGRVFGAWENEGQIFFRRLSSPIASPDFPIHTLPGKGGDRAHPSIAFNKNGDMLIAWTEGTGWQRGGALAWQVYDRNLKALESGRRAGAIGVWGLPAAIAETDGGFTIYH